MRLYLYGGAAVVALSAITATVVWFINADRDRRALDNANDYIEGTRDATDALTDLPDDADAIRWLRDFAE